MSETTTTESTTDADAGTGAGVASEGQNGARGGTAATQDADLTTERSANKLIKDFARSRGVTVSDLLKQFEDTENASKTDLQRALDKAADLEKRYGDAVGDLQRERAEKAIRDAAASAGARADRLASVYRLVREDVAYGDDGKPTNVAALVAQARTDAPEFFQAVTGSGDGGKGGAGVGNDPNAAINAALRQMSGRAGA